MAVEVRKDTKLGRKLELTQDNLSLTLFLRLLMTDLDYLDYLGPPK